MCLVSVGKSDSGYEELQRSKKCMYIKHEIKSKAKSQCQYLISLLNDDSDIDLFCYSEVPRYRYSGTYTCKINVRKWGLAA